MSDVAIIPPDEPRRLPTTNKPQRIGRRIKAALDTMVWDGKTDNEAAIQIGMTVTNIRLALKQPHIRAYYREQLQVLRERESSQNIHRLRAIRDAANNMPAVLAIKTMIGMDDEQQQRGSGASASPGVTIRIVNMVAPGQVVTQQSITDRHNE